MYQKCWRWFADLGLGGVKGSEDVRVRSLRSQGYKSLIFRLKFEIPLSRALSVTAKFRRAHTLSA